MHSITDSIHPTPSISELKIQQDRADLSCVGLQGDDMVKVVAWYDNEVRPISGLLRYAALLVLVAAGYGHSAHESHVSSQMALQSLIIKLKLNIGISVHAMCTFIILHTLSICGVWVMQWGYSQRVVDLAELAAEKWE